MRNLLFAAIAVFSLTLFSCEAKLDGSSDDAMKASVDKMKSSLSEEDAVKFEQALMTISLDGMNLMEAALSGNAEGLAQKVLTKIDGLTYDEVLTKADKINERVAAEKKEEAKKELAELMDKQQRAEAAKSELAKFEVSEARFFRRKSYIGSDPVIQLTISNGTDKAISKVHFDAKYVSEDRSVPWVHDGFNYAVPGGVEPGETLKWSLEPNFMSDWNKAQTVKDAKLVVSATQLEGADGEILYSSSIYGEEEEERTAEILEEYPDFK
jgi:hypothetical protein